MLDELIAPLGIPAIANVPVGHGKHMATMPLGVRARIDGDAKTLEVLEAAVEPRTDKIAKRRRVMKLRRISIGLGLLAATVALALAASGPATAQDPGNEVLRIGWSEDPKTLNPFIGVNEEEYTIWALNWELLLSFDPVTLAPSAGDRGELECLRRPPDRSPST